MTSVNCNVLFTLSEQGQRDAIRKGIKTGKECSVKLDLPIEFLDYCDVDSKTGDVSLKIRLDTFSRCGTYFYFDVYPTIDELLFKIAAISGKTKSDEAKREVDKQKENEKTKELFNQYKQRIEQGETPDVYNYGTNCRFNDLSSISICELKDIVDENEVKRIFNIASNRFNEQKTIKEKEREAREKKEENDAINAKEIFRQWAIKNGSEHLRLLAEGNFEWQEKAKEEFSRLHMPEGFVYEAEYEGNTLDVHDRTKPNIEEIRDLNYWKNNLNEVIVDAKLTWNTCRRLKIASLDLTVRLPNGKNDTVCKFYEDTKAETEIDDDN
jgi:hypothetical protein